MAENYWIKMTQQDLAQDDKFNEWKLQFDLYLDESGSWRCRGRQNNSNLSHSSASTTEILSFQKVLGWSESWIRTISLIPCYKSS